MRKKNSKSKGKLSKLKSMNCFQSKTVSKKIEKEKEKEKTLNLENPNSFPSLTKKKAKKNPCCSKIYLDKIHPKKEEEKEEEKEEKKEKKAKEGWIVLSVEDGKIQKKYGPPSQWKLEHIEEQKYAKEKKVPWYNKNNLEEYESGYDGGFEGCCEDEQDISNEFDIIDSPPKEEEYEECEEYY